MHKDVVDICLFRSVPFPLTFYIRTRLRLARTTNESNKQGPAVIYLCLITTNTTPAPNVNQSILI